MNVFNRVVMIILIIAVIVSTVAFLVQPAEVLNLALRWVTVLQDQLADNLIFGYLVAGCAVILFVMLLLLFLELRRSHFSIARVQTTGRSDVWLGVQSIAKTIEFRVDELQGVRTVKPKVTSRGDDIEVYIELDASPSASIIDLTEQVTQVCTDIVERQLGLKLHGKVMLQVTQQPYPRGAVEPDGSDAAAEPVPSDEESGDGDILAPVDANVSTGDDDDVIDIIPVDYDEAEAEGADEPSSE